MRTGYAPLFRRLANSEKFADLASADARCFYVMLLLVVDDWGRASARPRTLNAEVWPMLGYKPADVEKYLEDLRRVGLVHIYEHEGDVFLEVNDHESRAGALGKRDHRRQSELPDPSALVPLGPDWPELAGTGPCRPSRARALLDLDLDLDQHKGAAGPAAVVDPIAAHPSLDTPEFRVAWAEWNASRRERGIKAYRPRGIAGQLKKLARLGSAVAIEHIEHSIASEYQGIFGPKGNVNGNSVGTAAHQRNPRNDRRPDGTRPGEYAEPIVLPRIAGSAREQGPPLRGVSERWISEAAHAGAGSRVQSAETRPATERWLRA